MKLTRGEVRLRTVLVDLCDALPRPAGPLAKDEIRRLHRQQRLSLMFSLNGSFDRSAETLQENLARPDEIEVPAIAPRLVVVRAGTPESEIFAAATLTWSVPVSRGFGRRMRFLVRDETNGKLIGIIGLTDPVFNLKPRDAWVGWTAVEREERLIHVMDAFVLGALPPYSYLLGGKLVALVAASREVVNHFRAKYRASQGIISQRTKDPRLVLLTTTSALGRSSLYNRLRVPGRIEYLTGVERDRVATWFTQGYGHFHISEDVFRQMVQVLSRRKHPYAAGNRFGDGPNWKIRVIRRAAVELGISPDFLKHGVRRQVYLVPLAENTRSFLRGCSKVPRYKTMTVGQIAEFWRERWAKPRSERRPDWTDWRPATLIDHLRTIRGEHDGG